MNSKNIDVKLFGRKVTISDLKKLEKIGAGHDGVVYRYGDLALKYLKYDIEHRKEKNLMTFDKISYLMENLDLHRIIAPNDILLDGDGIYTGYVMPFIEDLHSKKKENTAEYRTPGSYLILDLLYAIADLKNDFEQLTENRVIAKDINRGSYIYAKDFLHLCDMDKYIIRNQKDSYIRNQNLNMLNFVLAKFLLYEMQKSDIYTRNDSKTLSNWVKKSSNSRTFIDELIKDMGNNYHEPISEYAEYKVKKLIK